MQRNRSERASDAPRWEENNWKKRTQEKQQLNTQQLPKNVPCPPGEAAHQKGSAGLLKRSLNSTSEILSTAYRNEISKRWQFISSAQVGFKIRQPF